MLTISITLDNKQEAALSKMTDAINQSIIDSKVKGIPASSMTDVFINFVNTQFNKEASKFDINEKSKLLDQLDKCTAQEVATIKGILDSHIIKP